MTVNENIFREIHQRTQTLLSYHVKWRGSLNAGFREKFTFEAQMRISDCMLKSKIYLIMHDRVSEVHYHVSQNILR